MTAGFRALILVAAFGVIAGASLLFDGFATVRIAHAEEAWKVEMADVCAKTQDSMALSKDELKILLERCERLKPLIEALEETPRKVYRKRLQMCCDLYKFVLESKEKDVAK